MQGSSWDELRFILAVARRRTMAGAARTLRVNESTVSRRISRTETRLRAKLFERSEGRLFPTQAGTEMVRRAEKIELEVQAAEEAVGGTDLQAAGTVRMTSVPMIVNRVLAPALPGFLLEHPDLQVDLIAEAADLSLIRREVDIAIRLARPQSEMRAIARRIGSVEYGIFVSRHLPAESALWITYSDSMSTLPQMRWISKQIGRSRSKLANTRVNDAETLLQFVKAGFGKSFLPVFVGDSDSSLVRVDDGSTDWSRELWLMVHPEMRHLTRMRVAIDWLIGIIQELSTKTQPQR